MRWIVLSMIVLGFCISCAPSAGMHESDGWNSRDRSVPGVKSHYGVTDQDDN
jgi:hypothetical protein